MINALAHITPVEAPTGLLLFLVGVASGSLATIFLRRFRAH